MCRDVIGVAFWSLRSLLSSKEYREDTQTTTEKIARVYYRGKRQTEEGAVAKGTAVLVRLRTISMLSGASTFPRAVPCEDG